jgi:hypothetical protein
MSANQWSDALIAQTRQALESHGFDMPGLASDYIHFKNADGGYGLMQTDDLLVWWAPFGIQIVESAGLVIVPWDGKSRGTRSEPAHAEKVGVAVEVRHSDGMVIE